MSTPPPPPRNPQSQTPACYRHPDRQATLRCTRCERPICIEDAIEAPVGYQCPVCAEGGQPVRRMADIATAPVTRVLVVTIGVLFVVSTLLPEVTNQFGLRPVLLAPGGPDLFAAVAGFYNPNPITSAAGEPWLIVTSGFLHANLMHVGFNGLLLWQLGHMLEPALGRGRFIALYAAGLAGGGLGVVALGWLATTLGLEGAGDTVMSTLGGNPFTPTIGASGAVFGLMGAAVVGLRQRGINPWKTSIGGLVLINLVLTFVVPGISVGGHVGGLIGGFVAGKLLFVDREKASRATVIVSIIAVAMVLISIALSAAIVSSLTF